jgi:hypothetical protein
MAAGEVTEQDLAGSEVAESEKTIAGKEKKLGRKLAEALLNLNTITAIMLALCALTTAWASWVSDLHGSDQDANYAKAQRLNTEANASYNLNSQTYIAAFNVWTYVYEENAEIKTLENGGDAQAAASKRKYLNDFIETNCPNYQNFKGAIYTALEKGGTATPFDEYPEESFFSDSENLANEATQVRESGDWNNLASDSFGLVSLLYSLCLFLFGLVGFYKHLVQRKVVFGVGLAVFVVATVYMFSLPMPVNFDLANYFSLIK